MSLSLSVVEGTLKPDGTLELDAKTCLSPGHVQVIVRPLPSVPTPRLGLAEVIRHIQQAQSARGFVGLSAQDLAAEQKLRQEEEDGYEQRCNDLWSQTHSGPPT